MDGSLYYGICALVTDEEGNEKESLFLVSDRKELIDTQDEEEMRRRGLRVKYAPTLVSRWSLKSVSEWINNSVSPPTTLSIFEMLMKKLRQYIELRDEREYPLVVVWVMGTYIVVLFQSFPYLPFPDSRGREKASS